MTKAAGRHGDCLHGGVCVCVCMCAAEKVSSLGKNWHRPCLRCERCSKTLAPGSHAEVSETYALLMEMDGTSSGREE